MSFSKLKRGIALGLLGLVMIASVTGSALGDDRKMKTEVKPAYPELAKRMNVGGAVKVEVVITPAGTVKSAKALGGHPLLIETAVEAAKKCRFEPASGETTQIVTFNFPKPQ